MGSHRDNGGQDVVRRARESDPWEGLGEVFPSWGIATIDREVLTHVLLEKQHRCVHLECNEALGVDLDLTCHHLNVSLVAVSKKQQPRRSFKEHANAVKEEVNKLKKARAIKEVFNTSGWPTSLWLRKKTGKWRVYVDFIDLNKACPKELFPVPRID